MTITDTLTALNLTDLMAQNRAQANAAVARVLAPWTRAAVYARSSADQEQTGITTAKQVADGRMWAAAEGIPVVALFVDDGASAWKPGTVRREFERMLREAKLGMFDVVVIRHTDRLYRQLAELPRIIAELAAHVRIVALHEGEIDLSTAAGIMTAQLKGAVAEHESRLKAERLKDHARHRAHSGRAVSTNRPFGWQWTKPCAADETCEHAKAHAPGARPLLGSRGGLVPHPVEGAALAAVYDMVSGGTSLYAAAQWLNDNGHTTALGKPFTGNALRQLLARGRHAGLVEHRGKLVAEAADGHRIVSPDLWQQVQRILADPSRRTNPGRRAGTVLSGIARCGVCGHPLNATNRHEYPRGDRPNRERRTVPIYRCRQHCAGRKREALDELVLGAVEQVILDNVERLAVEALTNADAVELAAQAEVDRLRRQLDGFKPLAATMDPADYADAVNGIRAALRDAEAKAAVVAQRPALARLTSADDVATAWAKLVEDPDVEPLRVLLRELVEYVEVRRGWGPLADHVSIEWQPWLRPILVEEDDR